MNPVKILSTAIALPEFARTTDEILPYVNLWLADEDKRFRDKVLRIFKYAKVDKRYGIMPIEDVFKETSFEDKNALFNRKAIDLGEAALKAALEKASLKPTDIDFIISVSCTGFMIPSFDAFIINRLRMKQDIVRLPVTEMGCAGGTSGLIYANNLLKANPGKRAAVICVESPTSTFQHKDRSMTNMVSAAIFGDGAACTILGSTDEKDCPIIRDTEMYHFYDEINMMGFKLRNTGLEMILDITVPDKIEKHFDQILLPFLTKNNIGIEDLQHLIFHPGGKKIVQIVEDVLGKMGKNIDVTKETLRKYGNMSSATVLYVLKEFMEQDIPKGDLGLMLSFGPGFSAQRLLIEF